jgi:alpha-beta hydrolase superfamily lysophospholipase
MVAALVGAGLRKLPDEARFEGKGGLKIAYRTWLPASAPKAVVVIVPGFNSHSAYYQWTAEKLAADGLAVYAVDLRGRGVSDGERFYVDDIEDYAGDVDGVVQIAKAANPGKKIFLLGHSAGGVTSVIYTLGHQRELAGLICESFAYKTPAPDFALAALKGLSHLAPHAHVVALANKDFTRDSTAVDAMNADALIAHETQPTKTMAALARADERLTKEFGKITLPVFILHGTADKATKPAGSQIFYDQAGSADKTLKFYDGHYHDMLNDIGKEQVLADIQAWIDARA